MVVIYNMYFFLTPFSIIDDDQPVTVDGPKLRGILTSTML